MPWSVLAPGFPSGLSGTGGTGPPHVAYGGPGTSQLVDLHDVVPVVIDHLYGDLAHRRLGERRLAVQFRLAQASALISAWSAFLSLSYRSSAPVK